MIRYTYPDGNALNVYFIKGDSDSDGLIMVEDTTDGEEYAYCFNKDSEYYNHQSIHLKQQLKYGPALVNRIECTTEEEYELGVLRVLGEIKDIMSQLHIIHVRLIDSGFSRDVKLKMAEMYTPGCIDVSISLYTATSGLMEKDEVFTYPIKNGVGYYYGTSVIGSDKLSILYEYNRYYRSVWYNNNDRGIPHSLVHGSNVEPKYIGRNDNDSLYKLGIRYYPRNYSRTQYALNPIER